MNEYLKLITEQLGIPIFLLAMILVWSAVWKALALWKSARKGSVVWFIVLSVVNTLGILEILYLFVFSEMKNTQKSRRKRRR